MLYNKITCFCFAWNFRFADYTVGQYLVKDKIFVCSRARPVCFIGGGFHPRDVAGLQQKSGQDAETACNVFHRRNGVLSVSYTHLTLPTT